jgi:hypothetical protein
MNRSKRGHASGNNSRSFVEPDFPDMQPLSRVRPNAPIATGPDGVFNMNPQLATLIAECIAEWAEIEYVLGLVLALILGTEARGALAMYLALSNFNAQIASIETAAEVELSGPEEECVAAVCMLARSGYKERNKLAHWCWGYTHEIPDAFLLLQPEDKILNLIDGLSTPPVHRDFDKSRIFVVRKGDMESIQQMLKRVRDFAGRLTGVLNAKQPAVRALQCQQLSNEPQMVEALSRLRGRRKNNQEAPEPPPRSGPST